MHKATALITGAGNGIGRAVAIKLSEMGYHLILTSRNKDTLTETAQLCKKECHIIPADLNNATDIESLINTIKSLNQLDVIFYSHGIHQRSTFLNSSLANITKDWQLYLHSILQIDHALLPLILQSPQHATRAIIYMGSVSSHLSVANNGSYTMCKHALKAHADTLFEEVRESGVKISTLYPGYINSREHTHTKLDPTKMIQISDIVLTVEYLLSLSHATCVTGIHIRPQFSPK